MYCSRIFRSLAIAFLNFARALAQNGALRKLSLGSQGMGDAGLAALLPGLAGARALTLPEGRWAVRSSSVAEDGEQASFAGPARVAVPALADRGLGAHQSEAAGINRRASSMRPRTMSPR